MIFLTDTAGLSSGVIGTLIAVSKVFDGASDLLFGALIDKTHTKMGKARPWMFYGYFGCAVCLVAIFSIPADMSDFSKYAWFFITYTVLNAGFYTANNIAYSALTALITKNNHERVAEIHVFSPKFKFNHDLIIIDTPGLDAEGLAFHEKITLQNVMPTVDMVMLAVLLSLRTITRPRFPDCAAVSRSGSTPMPFSYWKPAS